MNAIRHLRQHPFVRCDDERVRTRAYLHFLNGTHANDPVADWTAAEREELLEYAQTNLSRLDPSGQFEHAYDPPIAYVATIGDTDGKILVGAAATKSCALCDRPHPKFSTNAHLVGEAFGNRKLLTAEECDRCNHENGLALDNALSAMLLDDRVLAQLRKKGGGIVKAKFGQDQGSIGGLPRPLPLAINAHESESSVEFRERGTNRAALTFPARKFRPISALRAIGRMAYLALSREARRETPLLRSWVKGEVSIEPLTFWQFFYPRAFDTVGITVWKRRPAADVPEVVAMFHAAHSLILIAPANTTTRVLLPCLPLQAIGETLEGWQSTATSDSDVTSRTEYSLTGTAQMALCRVDEPMPVVVTIESAERRIELSATLTTPEPDRPWEVIRYDVHIDSLGATLTTVSHNGGLSWKCELSMDASPKAMELARDLAEIASRGMSMTIRDLKGRQIFPVSSGWLPTDPASPSSP